MIKISDTADTSLAIAEIRNQLNTQSIELNILNTMEQLPELLSYSSHDELLFELMLRAAIVQGSIDLSKSGLKFAIFRKSQCNEKYWSRTRNGGFTLLPDVKPGEAVMDIFRNGRLYATECATAMVIVYYKALLSVYGEEKFDQLFPDIYLMNWHQLDSKIASAGSMANTTFYLPGDRRYFSNPDVNPETPYLQGENAILLTNDMYYAHGMGITNANRILKLLNESRKKDATKSAYLRGGAGRLNFKMLYRLK